MIIESRPAMYGVGPLFTLKISGVKGGMDGRLLALFFYIMFIADDDRIYLIQNHKTQTVAELAKNLKRGTVKVNQWLEFLGLEAKKRDPQPRNHPFRMQNRRLEAMIIENRQEKSKKFK